MTIEKQKTDARQGNTNKANARVLVISLALLGIVILVAGAYFAT